MPELPEVQTIVNELNAVLPGRGVTAVQIFRANALGGVPEQDFRAGVEGRRFSRVHRRGKFLIFDFQQGGHLVGHLRMTGKFVFSPLLTTPAPHHRAWFHLDPEGADASRLLVFQDARCFGTLAVVDRLADYPPLQKLGVEPLSEAFDSAWITEALSGSKSPLKHWLMDQSNIAGLGNIYVSEILYRAKLSPLRPAQSLGASEAGHLQRSTRRVLQQAIQENGTTISDFRRVDDKSGGFQEFLKVYGKQGQPCPRCRTPIARTIQQQRSTFYCPSCQL